MIRMALLLSLVAVTVSGLLAAQDPAAKAPTAKDRLAAKKVRYEAGGTTFESVIVHQQDTAKAKPGILMVPNWMGPTEESLEQARRIAGDRFVVMMVDMYGVDTRPTNAEQAGAAAGFVRADRALMRARASKALEVFRAEGRPLGLAAEHVAAIGFCFGGGTVLELGRAGADVDAIVSFHGDLASPTLAADAGKTRAKVLVCHGADDPYVPQQDVQQFLAAMSKTDVDWQLVQYGGTVHSFTDPAASSDGARFHERSARRAFAAMDSLLRSIWNN